MAKQKQKSFNELMQEWAHDFNSKDDKLVEQIFNHPDFNLLEILPQLNFDQLAALWPAVVESKKYSFDEILEMYFFDSQKHGENMAYAETATGARFTGFEPSGSDFACIFEKLSSESQLARIEQELPLERLNDYELWCLITWITVPDDSDLRKIINLLDDLTGDGNWPDREESAAVFRMIKALLLHN